MLLVLLLPALILPALIYTCSARLVNVTIDDTYGDERTGLMPLYAPELWLEYSDSTDDDIPYRPLSRSDWLAAYNQTLHCKPSWLVSSDFNDDGSEDDNSTLPEARGSITFNGTAVYFYVARTPETTMEVTFYLDGAPVPVDLYLVSPRLSSSNDRMPGKLYDQLAYSVNQLPHEEHLLEFVLDNQSDAESCFDYAIYTMDDGTPSELEDPPAATRPPNPEGSTSSAVSGAGVASNPSEAAAARSHRYPPRGLLIAVPLVGGVTVAIVCAWVCARRRQRQQVRLEKSAGSRREDPTNSKQDSHTSSRE